MEELRTIGNNMNDKNIPLVRRRVLQITAELEDIREALLDSVRNQLSPRQLSVLDIDDQTVDTDPSTEYFGLEWDSLFGRCFSLGLDMRIFKQRLEAGVVDTIGLASMLKVLATVSGQVEQHQKALFSGNLSSNRLEVQLQQQLRVSAVGEMAMRNPVKYKKNKTESLVQKISVSRGNQERKHSIFKYEEKKKKSFMEKVSSLLDYV